MKPLDGLTVNVNLNYMINNSNFHKDWLTTYGYDVDGKPVRHEYNNANLSVYEYNEKNNYFNLMYAEYARSSGGHNVTLMAGFQSELLERKRLFSSAERHSVRPSYPQHDSTDPKVGGAHNSWSTAGFFGRSNYGISKDATCSRCVNLRLRDGSSRFTKEKRWNWLVFLGGLEHRQRTVHGTVLGCGEHLETEGVGKTRQPEHG